MVAVDCRNCGANYSFSPLEIPPTGKTFSCERCGENVSVTPPKPAANKATVMGLGPGLFAPPGNMAAPTVRSTMMGLGGNPGPGLAQTGNAAPVSADDGEQLEDGDGEFIDMGTNTGELSAADLFGLQSPALAAGQAQPMPTGAPEEEEDESTQMRGPFAPMPAGFAAGPKSKAPAMGMGAPPTHLPGTPNSALGAGLRGRSLTNLPAPASDPQSRAKTLGDDLLSPVGPAKPNKLTDMMAPKPSPSGPVGRNLLDLPAPVPLAGQKTQAGHALNETWDLPSPVGPAAGPAAGPGRAPSNLPTPARTIGIGLGMGLPEPANLPTPVGAKPTPANLPAPVGPRPGLGNLPTPQQTKTGREGTMGGGNLPAPKGFFDDLPGPHNAEVPAPKGFFDDVPGPQKNAFGLAPKGFFDEGAGGSGTQVGPKASSFLDEGARGFGPTPTNTGALPSDFLNIGTLGKSTMGGLGGDRSQPPSPLNLGDLGGGGAAEFGREMTGTSGDVLDLGDFGPSPGTQVPIFGGRMPGRESEAPLTLDPVDLELPETPNQGGDEGFLLPEPSAKAKPSFEDMDLASPSTGESARANANAGAVSFNSPGNSGPPPSAFAPKQQEADFDLETGPAGEAAAPEKKAKAKAEPSARPSKVKKKTLIIAASSIGVLAVLGIGGFTFWSKWNNEKDRAAQSAKTGRKAAQLLAVEGPDHWRLAGEEAEKLLKKDPHSAEALGILAESGYAAAFDEGIDFKARVAKADESVRKLRAITTNSPHAKKSFALQAIADKRYDDAIATLTLLAKEDVRDVNTQLYLGWAYQLSHDHRKAAAAFSQALKINPKNFPAQYGLAGSQLDLGNSKEAYTTYTQAGKLYYEVYKRENVGVLLARYQLEKVEKFSDREQAFLNVLARKGLDKMDPRTVARAWTLAGNEALRAGRVDEARVRFDKAMALDNLGLDPVVGIANADMLQGKLEDAQKRLNDVLATAPTHIEANLVLADVERRMNKLQEGMARVDELLARQPAIESPPTLTKIHLIRGAILEANPDTLPKAEDEYRLAKKSAEQSDISPVVALSALLVKMSRGKEALEELEPVRKAAETDPALAVTLGVAYLGSNDPKAAEASFRIALKSNASDVEARFQLGQALYAQGKYDEAVAEIKASFEANTAREDIGIRLALIYEAGERDDDALAMYQRLLKTNEPSLNARARAGRFYARTKSYGEVGNLARAILAQNSIHPAGLFLAGEDAYAKGNYAEAQKNFREASRLSPEPQYLEAMGRASEALHEMDEALRYYSLATAGDEKYLLPRLGRARVQLEQRAYSAAISELEAARAIRPQEPVVHRDLGKALLALRKYNEASQSLQTAVRINPNDAEAQYLLGLAFFELDRSGDASSHLLQATKNVNGEVAWLSDAYRQLGYAARAAGQTSMAIDAWKTYLQLDQSKSPQREDVDRLLHRLRAD